MNKKKVLLIGNGLSVNAMLEESLLVEGYDLVEKVSSCKNLVNDIKQFLPSVVVIDMEFPDDSVFERLSEVNAQCPVPVVLFSETGETQIIKKAVKANVGAFVADGLTARRVKPVIELAIERFKEISNLQSELVDTKKQLEERKIIEKAKGILMLRNNVSEDEAYQSIRKKAMKQNKKIIEIAENVIELAEMFK